MEKLKAEVKNTRSRFSVARMAEEKLQTNFYFVNRACLNNLSREARENNLSRE